MAWYNTGTIALTNGSATVTGSGTNFLVGAQIGEALYAPDGKLYEIQTINSATVITLASTYLGSTASTQGYQIIPTQSLVADLASDVTDLISDFANVRDYAGNGKFNDGAVGTPGITFTQDQDNGLYRIGSNNWALAAGGQKIVDISTSGISVTGIVGNLTFPDNSKAIFGAGSDLQIYHDGTASYVSDQGTGSLFIRSGSNIYVQNSGGTANYFKGTDGGAAELFHNGSTKLATTATGIDVTGSVTADGLTASASTADYIASITNSNGTDAGGGLFVSTRWNTDANSVAKFVSNSGSNVVANFAGNGDISFYEDTGTTPKFFWDASAESLGIGIASGDGTLHVHTASAGTISASSQADDLVIENSVEGGMTIITPDNQSARIRFTSPSTTADVGGASIFYRQNINKMSMGTEVAGGILAFKSGAGNEGLLLDASSNLLVGTTTTPSLAGLAVGSTVTGKNISVFSSANGSNGLIGIYQSNGTQEGQIYAGTGDVNLFGASVVKIVASTGGVKLTSGATSWVSNSDERAKDIIEPISNAVQKVSTLRSVIGKYKTDSEGTRRSFLIAQDVQAVLPEAVDATDEDNLGVRYTETIPLLVAAIKEQQATIEALTARIAALES